MDSLDELRKRVEAIRWFHSIDLGNGITTAGQDDSSEKSKQVCIPNDLDGKSVLDIGAWNGFFSFEAEKKGAERVLATDHFCWSGPGWGTKDGFDLAREILNSKVEDLEISVEDISPETVGTFDVVLFLGVLYHLKDPMHGLEIAASVCDDLLIIETLVDDLHRRKPSMVYYPKNSMNNDDTNYWAPNVAALKGMLRDLGFSHFEITYPKKAWLRYALPIRILSAIKGIFEKRGGFFQTVNQGRMTIHARR